MDIALLAVRAVLAAVFAVAGAAKLADREGSRQAAAAFGVPASLSGAVGIGLPFAELAVAALLLPAAAATWAALGAFALLAAFSIAIGRSIARGEAPDCHCFGQLHSEPAGWSTLARNLGLAGGAAFVAAAGWKDPGASAVAWLGDLHGSEIVAVVAVAVATVSAAAAAGLLRSVRGLVRRVAALEEGGPVVHAQEALGLPVGTHAPGFALSGVTGGEWTLERLLARDKPVLLVFSDSNCPSCEVLMPDVARWQDNAAVGLTIAVVSAGEEADLRAKADSYGIELMLSDPEQAAYRAYENAGTPGAVLVGLGGRIARPLAVNPAGIHELIEAVSGVVMPPLEIGDDMPDLELPNLDGVATHLDLFRGRETVLLFWDPELDECQALLPDVRAWEEERVAMPALAIVVFGDREGALDEGFRSPVLLDEDRSLTLFLRAIEPPCALVFDAEGRIAWPLAHGAEHILRLLRSHSAPAPAGEPAEMV